MTVLNWARLARDVLLNEVNIIFLYNFQDTENMSRARVFERVPVLRRFSILVHLVRIS